MSTVRMLESEVPRIRRAIESLGMAEILEANVASWRAEKVPDAELRAVQEMTQRAVDEVERDQKRGEKPDATCAVIASAWTNARHGIHDQWADPTPAVEPVDPIARSAAENVGAFDPWNREAEINAGAQDAFRVVEVTSTIDRNRPEDGGVIRLGTSR